MDTRNENEIVDFLIFSAMRRTGLLIMILIWAENVLPVRKRCDVMTVPSGA